MSPAFWSTVLPTFSIPASLSYSLSSFAYAFLPSSHLPPCPYLSLSFLFSLTRSFSLFTLFLVLHLPLCYPLALPPHLMQGVTPSFAVSFSQSLQSSLPASFSYYYRSSSFDVCVSYSTPSSISASFSYSLSLSFSVCVLVFIFLIPILPAFFFLCLRFQHPASLIVHVRNHTTHTRTHQPIDRHLIHVTVNAFLTLSEPTLSDIDTGWNLKCNNIRRYINLRSRDSNTAFLVASIRVRAQANKHNTRSAYC